MVAFSYSEFGIPTNDSIGLHINWSGQLTWLKDTLHLTPCREMQAGGKEEAPLGAQAPSSSWSWERSCHSIRLK